MRSLIVISGVLVYYIVIMAMTVEELIFLKLTTKKVKNLQIKYEPLAVAI